VVSWVVDRLATSSIVGNCCSGGGSSGSSKGWFIPAFW